MAVLALAGLAVLVVLPDFRRAKLFSGPGISGNLRYIELAKEHWLADGHTNEWPTAKDLFPSTSPGVTFQNVMRPKYGDFPKACGHYQVGDILVLASNGVAAVRQ